MAFVTAAGQVTESVSQSCCAGDVILLPGREVGAFGGEQVGLLKDELCSLLTLLGLSPRLLPGDDTRKPLALDSPASRSRKIDLYSLEVSLSWGTQQDVLGNLALHCQVRSLLPASQLSPAQIIFILKRN